MRFDTAQDLALTFWEQPPATPFPANVQNKLLRSYRADFQHLGAMSVVYNGLLARDTKYIDVAEDILRDIPLDEAQTADAMVIIKDLSYLDCFRALIDPELRGSFGTQPKEALVALNEARDRLAKNEDFQASDAAGIMSEALVMFLLNAAGFETVPSFPWEDQPYGIAHLAENPAFDAYVLTDGVSTRKIQVKSSLAKPPKNICEEQKETWHMLDLEARRDIMVRSYAPDIGVIVLETDLGIHPAKQQRYFKNLGCDTRVFETSEWAYQAMDTVTAAIW